jgi:hypothetical protein
MEEDAMCYSMSWTTSEDRKREEAKRAQTAHEQRAAVINGLLKGVEKSPEPNRISEASAREPATAK